MKHYKTIITTYENGTIIEYKNASKCSEALGVSRQYISKILERGEWLERGIVKIERVGATEDFTGISSQWWYSRYKAMIARCYNITHPAYESYGAKGIYVCEEWLADPLAYGSWIEEQRLALEIPLDKVSRYDVDKDISELGYYGPDACLLVSKVENISKAKKGVPVSEETKEKMRNSSPTSKTIKCVETGEVFQSIKQCADAMGLHQPSITRVLSNKQKTANGYTFVEVK